MTDPEQASKEKLQQLQMMEQSVQAIVGQKQNFQMQQLEIDSAIENLKGKQKAFQIIGNILVEKDAESLKKELSEKKNMVSIRLKALEKQEEQIKEKSQKLQSEVLKGMKK